MSPTTNHTVIFNEIPTGYPVPGQTLKKVASTIDLDAPLPTGSILVKTKTLSLDPYLRGRMRPVEVESYAPAFPLGEPLNNFGVSEVLKSANPSIKVGAHVYGATQFSEYQTFDAEAVKGLRVLENKEKLPWTTWVGAAGMPGQTAWLGLDMIAKPKKGETIFISGAAGPVGQMVAALCHQAGLKVIGSAGSDEKVAFLKNDLKFEAAWNYKKEDTQKVLEKYGPYEIYWDNVGGKTLDAALATILPRGRIVVCGAAAQYNEPGEPIKNAINILTKTLHVEGFIVIHHDVSKFYDTIPALIASGAIKPPKEHIVAGLDSGESFLDLMTGANFGKAVIVL